jgi:hypothetical protein
MGRQTRPVNHINQLPGGPATPPPSHNSDSVSSILLDTPSVKAPPTPSESLDTSEWSEDMGWLEVLHGTPEGSPELGLDFTVLNVTRHLLLSLLFRGTYFLYIHKRAMWNRGETGRIDHRGLHRSGNGSYRHSHRDNGSWSPVKRCGDYSPDSECEDGNSSSARAKKPKSDCRLAESYLVLRIFGVSVLRSTLKQGPRPYWY